MSTAIRCTRGVVTFALCGAMSMWTLASVSPAWAAPEGETDGTEAPAPDAERLPAPDAAQPPAPNPPSGDAFSSDLGKYVHAGVQLRTSIATGREGWGQDIINVRPTVVGRPHRYMQVEAVVEFDRHVIPVPPQSAPGMVDADVVALLETRHVAMLDAVVKLELHRAVNLWVGRFRPPADRSSLSDVYYINAWNYPDLVHQYPSLVACEGAACIASTADARESMVADGITNAGEQDRRITRAIVRTKRDEGAALWGFVDRGQRVKYQIGAFNLHGAPTHNVRGAGRLTVNFFDPEPGYYNESTYFGERQILAVGLAGQFQRQMWPYEVNIPDGIIDAYADMASFSLDVLFERRLGRGTLTLEGAYYNFTDTFPKFERSGMIVGDVLIPTTFKDRRQQSYFALGSYLFPAWGPGRPQFLARYQGSPDHVVPNGKNELGSSMYTIDAFLSYVLAGHRARLFAGYQFIYINTTNTPMWVQLGFQGQI